MVQKLACKELQILSKKKHCFQSFSNSGVKAVLLRLNPSTIHNPQSIYQRVIARLGNLAFYTHTPTNNLLLLSIKINLLTRNEEFMQNL